MSSIASTPRIIFFGTPDFAVPTLQALVEAGMAPMAVVPQPSKPVGRHAEPVSSPVAVAARELGIAVSEPSSIKRPEFIDWLTAQKPDVAVLVAYGKILPAAVLAIP